MKVSVSLPETDVSFVDEYAGKVSTSRSAVIQQAIGLLRASQLEDEYTAAWEEWESGGDAGLWERTSADGVSGAAG